MFKNLNGLAQVLKNASSMGEKIKEMRENLAAEVVSGSSGADLVQVKVTGVGEVRKVQIAQELFDRNDREMIEELIPAAMNEALTKVRQLHVEKMREATGGLEIPGLEDALGNM